MRQSGYYWVKHESNSAWEVGEYAASIGVWYLSAIEFSLRDRDFTEINETRILNPDEPHLTLTKEAYNLIEVECKKFRENSPHHVTAEDVIFTFLNPNVILNDWDEGPSNDPLWNHELNMHSAVVFINKTVKLLKP